MPRGAIDRHPTLLLVALALVAAVKAALFWIDHAPIFFFGDSESYLYAAVTHLAEAHRSYLYAAIIRALAAPAGSLTWLMVAQSLAAAATAVLLVLTLVRQLGVAPGIAIVAGLALALDPMQLLAERMVLPETFASLVFVLWTMVVFRYLRSPTIAALVTSCLLGVVLVAFRVVFVPVAIATTAVVPFLARCAGGVDRTGTTAARRRLGHLALAVVVTALLHVGYRALVHEIAGVPRTYIPGDGFWTAAAWAPMLEPDDATDPRAAAVIAALPTSGPSSRRSIYNRDFERWEPDGMVRRLVRAFGDDEPAANEAARALAFRALRRDPAGVARLAGRTYLGYFGVRWRFEDVVLDDEGMLRGFTPARGSVVHERLGIDTGPDVQRRRTPVQRWHHAGRAWYALLALTPLVLLVAVALSSSWRRPLVLAVLVATAVLLIATCFGANGPVPRYLHPCGFTCLLGLAVVADRCVTVRPLSRPCP